MMRNVERLRDNSWSFVLKHLLLPLGDIAFRQRMMHRLHFLEQAQWWGQERIHSYRDSALISLVGIAYAEVPFYRQLMDEAGVRPKDIRRPRDLMKLPVVSKDMLRAGYPLRTTRKTGFKTYEARTSGSTGQNFSVLEDAETAGWYRATLLLSLQWAGWRIGERHLQTGMTTSRTLDRRLKDALMRCHYVSAYDLSDQQLDYSLDLLDRYGIQHLWGYPGSLYLIAQRALQKRWNQPLCTVVTWGDNLYPHYRRVIEQAFGTKVTDTYGCGEGMHIAGQCGVGTTYHVHNLDVVVEYLSDDGQSVPPGVPGNIVVTRLHPGPMPLIRYRVGDICVSGAGRQCPCGRGFDIMESVEGRETDLVLTPSGNRLIVHFFTGILEHFTEIGSFQVVQEELSSITLRVVPAFGYSPEVSSRVIARLRDKGAADLRIDLEVVPEIPLPPSHKRRFVVSKIGKISSPSLQV